MSLQSSLTSLAQAIGTDVGTIYEAIGTLANLTTTEKASLVGSLNELRQEILDTQAAAGASINDAATSSTTTTYSVDKILDLVLDLETKLVGGAGAALDTFGELAAELADQDSAVAGIVTALTNRLRVDAAQGLTSGQQTQGRTNLAAASAADLTALTTAVGNTDTDLVAVYNTAKA